ncbi:uncharacterized protein BT62DRAFT_936093 [Guyanagaster necrorhizus]|uniref:Uncharacterized protein n=1 Tax=Guyanagaster necrorhizus TaxID=856835 RepID=A0A9P8APV8_9AGAR|nr:uncharacterized protein BT62DRAFT_936093 [Guyanagaster necrorhizus MCA 3950]KAG7442252.1 hypothetical protein BT62DRAFT_936093 [Guyanagaster necrorhizus MCA 3950]
MSGALNESKNSRQKRNRSTVKAEPTDEDDALVAVKLSPDHGWQHPAELDYIDAGTMSKATIIEYLITHSFSVPPKRNHWATITSADETTTVIPAGYRIPLLFAAYFQWTSLQLVLGSGEWDQFKSGILHISRLCDRFLEEARVAMHGGMMKGWRCPTFDRVLVRYHLCHLLSDPKSVKEFWEAYGEVEYANDVVKFDWKRWALTGHRGFKLSEEEIKEGVGLGKWLHRLRESDGDWVWDTSPDSTGRRAMECLEEWRKTKVWPTTTPVPDESTSKIPKPKTNDPILPPSTKSISHPPSTPPANQDILQFLKARIEEIKDQERRITALEADLAMLKTTRTSTSPMPASESEPEFIPAANFPNPADVDCASSFWQDPLKRFLYVDGLEEPEAEDGDVVMEDASVSTGPIKSWRKFQRMRG